MQINRSLLIAATLLATVALAGCTDSTAETPPSPDECEGIEDQEDCTSKDCVFYANAVWYSLPDSCDPGEERPACLAPERLDQPTNNPVVTLKPDGSTEPDVAIRVSGEQPLQGWETCTTDDGGACNCPD